MADDFRPSGQSTPTKAQHLCVFVHGLWGNAGHLNYVAQSLRDKYSEDELIILKASRNSGSFTYDGVEIGAERVAKEIEDTLEELGRDGYKITKFSIVGYSLGGLVARYVIGLLYHKGYFERIKPVNFTTFATPHLGVRTPLTGYANHVWNVLGARALSTSGRQLFTVDDFRGTGRPLLSVLADPDSIFIHALARFELRSLYTNIINDRSAVFYTTAICKTDPFTDLNKLNLKYENGYEPVILDKKQPFELVSKDDLPSFYKRVSSGSRQFFRRAPIYAALILLLPVVISIFIINSAVQTFRSRRRILLHESDQEGRGFEVYRIPYMVQDVRAGLEDAFETVNASQKQEYLPHGSEEMAETSQTGSSEYLLVGTSSELPPSEKARRSRHDFLKQDQFPEFPTLALTKQQFAMIKALDEVGFRKHLVHIHKSSHSHAAMIVRMKRAAFDDGKVVVKHWLEEEFKI